MRHAMKMLAMAAALCLMAGMISCSRQSLVANPFPDQPKAIVARPISVESARADLRELFELVEATSPRPYMYRSRDEVKGKMDQLAANITSPVSQRQMARLVAEACAGYGVAHQYVLMPHQAFNSWRDSGGKTPSFRLKPDGPRLHITASRLPDLPDDSEVVRVNGLASDELLDRLRSLVSAETDDHRDHLVAERSKDLLWLLGLDAPYVVEVRAKDGLVAQIADAGQVPEPRASFYESATTKRAQTETSAASAIESSRDFSLRWPEPDVALIRWDTMNPLTAKQWSEFLKASFADMRERRAAGLIIDLRGNRGGSSPLARELLGHFTSTPLRFSGGKVWRKSVAYDEFLKSCVVWWARLLPWRSMFSPDYAEIELGQAQEMEPPAPVAVTPREPRFEGPVGVLIGPGTFSSGVMLADAVATYQVAPLFGRPTGGVPNSLGELGFHRLSNSGLVVSFCSALFVRASGDAADPSPVVPTFRVADGPRPHVGDRDADDVDIQAAIAWIRSQRTTP